MDKERAMLAGSLARAAEILVNRQSLAGLNGPYGDLQGPGIGPSKGENLWN